MDPQRCQARPLVSTNCFCSSSSCEREERADTRGDADAAVSGPLRSLLRVFRLFQPPHTATCCDDGAAGPVLLMACPGPSHLLRLFQVVGKIDDTLALLNLVSFLPLRGSDCLWLLPPRRSERHRPSQPVPRGRWPAEKMGVASRGGGPASLECPARTLLPPDSPPLP